MTIQAWSRKTAFSVGDIVRPTVDQGTGLNFKCITAGTSSGKEPGVNSDNTIPIWPKNIGDEVVDGTCTWVAISATFSDLVASNPSAIIELFQLRLNAALHGSEDIYYFHAGSNDFGDANIVFDSQTYPRVPIKVDGFEYINTGTLPRPTMTVSNLSSNITALLLFVNKTTSGNDLGGAELRRIRTLAKYIDSENFREEGQAIGEGDDFLLVEDGNNLLFKRILDNSTADPNVRFPDERWFVDRKASETRDSVTFELASKFDLANQKIPRRQIIANVCQWEYKKAECGYIPGNEVGKTIVNDGVSTTYHRFDINDEPVTSDSKDVCGKRISSCKCRFGENKELPFGSFPGAGLTK